jgi:hypothetical protein
VGTIGTAEYGYVTGRTSAVGDDINFAARVTYSADGFSYVTLDVATSNHTAGSEYDDTYTLAGVYKGAPITPVIVYVPSSGLGQAWFKCVAREVGQNKGFEIWAGIDLAHLTRVLTYSIYGLGSAGYWVNTGGSNFVLTPVAAASPVSPNPPKTEWYTKQNETTLDGAYGRVSMLNAAGAVDTIYSNGDDGDDTLVAINLHEYFDPTTTKAQINSGSFSIYTPFDKSTPQTEITAFLADFPKNGLLEVERGWLTETGGVQTYDVVSMGHFFITEVTLDHNSWILTVEFHDTFGLLSETNVPCSDILNGTGQNTVFEMMDAVLTTAEASIPMTVPDTFVDLDSAVDYALVSNPIDPALSSNQVINNLANLCGARWYLDNTGRYSLVATNKINVLDYKLNDLHVFGIPQFEKYEQPALPHSAAIHSFSDAGNRDSSFTPIPQSSQSVTVRYPLSLITTGGDSEDPSTPRYVSLLTGDVAANLLESVLNSAAIGDIVVYDYCAVIPPGVWINPSDSSVYPNLFIQGSEFRDIGVNEGVSVVGSSVDNPLVSLQREADAVLSWSFPDYHGRSYRFSMRDDPSLKCGNVVQLAVDNEYLLVLLVEARRTFNGAGRVEFVAVYLDDTGENPFETAVTTPVATWRGSASPTSGVDFTWDGVAGYDDWDNPNFAYRIYRTSDTPDTLLADVPQSANTYAVTEETTSGETFGISVLTGGYEWEITPFEPVVFDNTAANNRKSGTFAAGQPRLY